MTSSDDRMSALAPSPRCLVLGGGGFLGGHIVEALQDEGLPCVSSIACPDGQRLPASTPTTEWYEGDFGNRGDVAAALEDCDVAFHLVATTLPRSSNEDPIHDLESNLVPTVRFLAAAVECGVKKVVFASSGGTVYGIPQAVPIAENHATQPLCSYGIHKLAIEQYLHLYHSLHGLDYCVLRLANPFGERQRSDASQGAVAVFLDQALRGEEITVWGDGCAVRDYVYVGDVARAFCLAATSESADRHVQRRIGQGPQRERTARRDRETARAAVPRRYAQAPSFRRARERPRYRLADRVLGWRPRVTFQEALERTLRWLQASR